MSYEDIFQALNDNKVIYIVIGGFAVNFYGYSRMTEDLDILFKPTSENGEKLLSALHRLDFEINTFNDHNFSEPTHLRLGDPPNSIDLINETKGLDLTKVFDNAIFSKIENILTPIISIEDLIANKKALNTYKDLADAEVLTKIRKKEP